MAQPLTHANRRIIKPREGRPALELVRYPLYSRKQIATTAGSTQFFKNLGSATPLDSNMPNDGFLPEPQIYDIYGIQLFLTQGLNEDDIIKFINESIVSFSMSGKQYLQVPVHLVPSGGGLNGVASTTKIDTTIFQVSNGVPHPETYLPMDIAGIPLPIVSQQDWYGMVQTFNTVAFTAPFYVYMKLIGILGRPVL